MLNFLSSLVKKTVKAELLEFCQHPDKILNHSILDEYLQEINAAHFHPYQAGGKLVRPLLLSLMAGSFGGPRGVSNALSAAAAVECAHTYSLVHDDLPCMDNDSLRRGQPTVHTVYGHAKGLLVGDGLLTGSFEILSYLRSCDEALANRSELILKLIQIFSHAIGMRGMIWGQWLDISEAEFHNKILSETSEDILSLFKTIHHNKTGRLFAACMQMGFLCGVYSIPKSVLQSEELQTLEQTCAKIGLEIGFAFQLMDDILDSSQTSKQLGKTAGKDKAQNKLTAVNVLSIQKAKSYVSEIVNQNLLSLEEMFKFYSNKDTQEYQAETLSFLKSLINRAY